MAGLRRWLSASVTAPVGCIPNAQMSLSHADSVTIELGCPLDPQIPKNVWRVSSFDVWNVWKVYQEEYCGNEHLQARIQINQACGSTESGWRQWVTVSCASYGLAHQGCGHTYSLPHQCMLPQHSAGVLGTLAIHAFSKTQLEIGARHGTLAFFQPGKTCNYAKFVKIMQSGWL